MSSAKSSISKNLVSSTQGNGLQKTDKNIKSRAKVRRKYIKLQKYIRDISENSAQNTSELADALNYSDRLYDSVTNVREANLDSQLLKYTAELGLEKSSEFSKLSFRYSLQNFPRMMKEMFNDLSSDDVQDRMFGLNMNKQDAEFNWNSYALAVNDNFFNISSTPLIDSFLPYMNLPKKDPRKRKVASSSRTIAALKPEEIKAGSSKIEKIETSSRVIQLQKQISSRLDDNGNSNDVLEILNSPDSFSGFVENLFDFSFLLKENKVAIHGEDLKIHLQKNEQDLGRVPRKSAVVVLDEDLVKKLMSNGT